MAKAKEARDRVALVTGAASGIGLATVERLLEAGWKVAALDRDEGALASVAGKIGKPQRVFTSTLDVTNEVAAEKAVAMVGEALGRIDGSCRLCFGMRNKSDTGADSRLAGMGPGRWPTFGSLWTFGGYST